MAEGQPPEVLELLIQCDRRFGESLFRHTPTCQSLFGVLSKRFPNREFCVQVVQDDAGDTLFLVLNRTTNLAVEGCVSRGYLYNSYNVCRVGSYEHAEADARTAPTAPVLLSTVWIASVPDMVQRSFECMVDDGVALGVPSHVYQWRRLVVDSLVFVR